MKTPKAPKLPAIRNATVQAMTLRCKAGKMKHRTAPRGGAKNKQAAYRTGDY